MNHIRNTTLPLLFILLMVIAGCSTTEPVREPMEDDTPDDTAAVDQPDEREILAMLDANRSSLGDLYVTQQNDIPEVFLQEQDGNRQQADPYAGYRIQILSTRDLAMADSVAGKFRVWADSTISGYNAESYTIFRQPFYKVHVGDFQNRELAGEFSSVVQRQWPDAWVVPDRIEPERIPADTARFELAEELQTGNSQ